MPKTLHRVGVLYRGDHLMESLAKEVVSLSIPSGYKFA
jgi:hypothetical protein